MFWKTCFIHNFTNNFGDFTKITFAWKENEKNETYWIYLKTEDFIKIENENLTFESEELNLSLETINFLRKGEIPRNVDGKILRKAYVTNAVANSVVFYAFMFLNRSLNSNQIQKLRGKYSFENLENNKFNIEELKKSFLSQSVFFLNLYKHMNENDRFENFADNLQQQKIFKDVFRFYEDSSHLKKNYNRRIFHTHFECESMISDYVEEDKFHRNTGIFSGNKIIKKDDYYILDSEYLRELGMNNCKKCNIG